MTASGPEGQGTDRPDDDTPGWASGADGDGSDLHGSGLDGSDLDGAEPRDELIEPEVIEHSIGASPAGKAANGALRALARAARSFLIYDANNQAIRAFLADFRDETTAALTHGPVELVVRPFEMVLHGETVYVQRDRDKSLAFRLYRDGVRRLTIATDVPWPELLRLLEILSIRYTGVRQNEDDIVTLLWKAGFTGIEMVAVEGFVLAGGDDDAGEALPGGDGGGGASEAGAQVRRSGPRVEVPSDWDRPAPHHHPGDSKALAFREISETSRSAMADEISSRAVGTLAVLLCREMLQLVADPTDPTDLVDASGILEEVRGLLLAEGQLAGLLELARAVSELEGEAEEERFAELRRFTNSSALRRILRSAARSGDDVPPELHELLELVSGDHLTVLVDLLGVERAVGSRRLARKLIQRYIASQSEYVGELIQGASPDVAADLMRAVVDVDPIHAATVVPLVLARDEPDLHVEIRRVLEVTDAKTVSSITLVEWLSAPVDATRTAIVTRLGTQGGGGVYESLVKHLDNLPSKARDEAIVVGLSLAKLNPVRALDEMGDWVRPRSFWNRVRGAALAGLRPWAGVAGLGTLDGDYPELAIRWRSERAAEDLHQHCQRTLTTRRREGRRGGVDHIAEGVCLHHRGILAHPGKLVLTPTMLCFVPTRGIDRLVGARELDLVLRKVERAEIKGLDRMLTVDIDGQVFRFSGAGARAVHQALAPEVAVIESEDEDEDDFEEGEE
jgi:hypothetical protein